MPSLDTLPAELLLRILAFLPVQALRTLRLASRSWNAFFREHESTIYHHAAPISHETTYPTCQPAPAESNARYMYTTTLAPKFWPKLCSCQGKLFPNSNSVIQGADKVTRADPTQYSISQEIFREDGNQMLSSVVYHFVFASSPSSSTRSISPASVDDGCSIDYTPSVSGSVSEPFLHLDLSTGINFLLIIVKSWG